MILAVVYAIYAIAKRQGILLGYIINYTKNESGVSQTKEVRRDQLKYKIEGLEFARYFVKVAGFTAVGNGKLTDPLIKFPNEGVPSKPRDVRAQLEDGSINVVWEEPADPNGILTRYEVYCKGTRLYNSSFQINLQIVTPRETSRFALIKKADVKPGTKFTIYLKAFTSKGEGEQSDPAVVNTPSAAPPPPPTPRVVEDEVTPFTITISLTMGRSCTVQSKHAQQPDKDDSKVHIVAASLGTVLFLALTALSVAVVFLLKHKKRREKDTRDNISMNTVRGEAEELILNPADRGRQQRLSIEESEYADLDTYTMEYADLDTHTMATPNGNTYASLLRSEGGNNLEESSAIYLFPRSGKEEEPLSPIYVNQIPTPTYENI